jgi:hypothetical protein
MAHTQLELDALKRAYALGALEVEHEGRKVRYASGSDLERRIRQVESEIVSLATGSNPTVAGYASFDRDG